MSLKVQNLKFAFIAAITRHLLMSTLASSQQTSWITTLLVGGITCSDKHLKTLFSFIPPIFQSVAEIV